MRKIGVPAALLAGVAVGAAVGTRSGAGHRRRFPARVRSVNLAHVNDPATTPVFPGDPEFRLGTAATVAADGFYLQFVQEGEHTGTHWAAPAHFAATGARADDLTPSDLLLPAVRIDLRAHAAADPDYQVTVDDLRAFERRYGRIPRGAAVIAWFGWDVRWGTPAYPNTDSDGAVHQPGFGPAAVHWLIATGRLGRSGAIGTDTFGPDPGLDSTYAASALLLREHRIGLENLANLGALPPTGAYVIVGGPINRAGSGSTATVWGLLTDR
jgi:kynurenine formamidase